MRKPEFVYVTAIATPAEKPGLETGRSLDIPAAAFNSQK